jgi:hypothetical protein
MSKGEVVTTDNKGSDAGSREVAEWLSASAEELAELITGSERDREEIFQAWLERHPAFVPGALGPNGMSGHEPWPMALITQPRLSGLGGKIPDFCWLAADSAHLTAVLVEIETPAKTWQHSGDAGQSAELTQAVEQLNSWRAWFAQPDRAAGFLREYRLPSHYCDLTFTQHYVLIHGSRAEYEGNRVREGQRAAGMTAPDAVFMSFDRLLEIAPARAARYGCVRIDEEGYHAVSVPPIWMPGVLDEDAIRASSGYEYVLEASDMPPDRAARYAEEIVSRQATVTPRFRYQPPSP